MSEPWSSPSGPSSRSFFLPAVGTILIFAALGPAIGGAVFVPLAMLAEAQGPAVAHLVWIAGLIGHAFALIPAYVLGLFPAALAGLVYALYDAWAPPRFPRALVAALIGALFAHMLSLWIASAGEFVVGWVGDSFGGETGDTVSEWTNGEFDLSLYRALLASGAAAAFFCALIAQLLGLRTRA